MPMIYDALNATRLAHQATPSTDQQLFQSPEGEFFLMVMQTYVDGLKLKPYEAWLPLTPSDADRLSYTETIIPLKRKEALEWCIKCLIPETFKGYLLESI